MAASQERVRADEQRQEIARAERVRETLILQKERDVKEKSFELSKALGNRTREGIINSQRIEGELKNLRKELEELKGT